MLSRRRSANLLDPLRSRRGRPRRTTARRPRRSTSAGQSSTRPSARRRRAAPPAADMPSTGTSTVAEHRQGEGTASIAQVDVSLCGQRIGHRRRPRPRAKKFDPALARRRALDGWEVRRGRRRRGELGPELPERAVLRAGLDEPERGGVPEERRAAVRRGAPRSPSGERRNTRRASTARRPQGARPAPRGERTRGTTTTRRETWSSCSSRSRTARTRSVRHAGRRSAGMVSAVMAISVDDHARRWHDGGHVHRAPGAAAVRLGHARRHPGASRHRANRNAR